MRTGTVHGVVEGVTADLVARLDEPGDDHVGGGERQRWQEAPQQFGCHGHRLAPANGLEGVTVGGLQDQRLGDQVRVALARRQQLLWDDAAVRADGELHGPDSLATVKQRQPEPDTIGDTRDRGAQDRRVRIGAARHRAVHRLLLVLGRIRQWHGYQDFLRVVDEVDHEVVYTDEPSLLRHHRGHVRGSAQVSAREQAFVHPRVLQRRAFTCHDDVPLPGPASRYVGGRPGAGAHRNAPAYPLFTFPATSAKRTAPEPTLEDQGARDVSWVRGAEASTVISIVAVLLVGSLTRTHLYERGVDKATGIDEYLANTRGLALLYYNAGAFAPA